MKILDGASDNFETIRTNSAVATADANSQDSRANCNVSYILDVDQNERNPNIPPRWEKKWFYGTVEKLFTHTHEGETHFLALIEEVKSPQETPLYDYLLRFTTSSRRKRITSVTNIQGSATFWNGEANTFIIL